MSATAPTAPSWPAFARRVIAAMLGPSRAPTAPSAATTQATVSPEPTAATAALSDTGAGGATPAEPREHSGAFVTLHCRGRLRACMGTLDATLSTADAVRHAAVCAALHDPRFPPVSTAELPDLDIEVSILTPPRPMRSLDDLELGRDGIHVQRGSRHGLFLPQVAIEHRMDKRTFLSRCCEEKAGLPPDAWRDPDTEVLLFSAAIFHET